MLQQQWQTPKARPTALEGEKCAASIPLSQLELASMQRKTDACPGPGALRRGVAPGVCRWPQYARPRCTAAPCDSFFSTASPCGLLLQVRRLQPPYPAAMAQRHTVRQNSSSSSTSRQTVHTLASVMYSCNSQLQRHALQRALMVGSFSLAQISGSAPQCNAKRPLQARFTKLPFPLHLLSLPPTNPSP